MNQQPADLVLHNGKIATQDDRRSVVKAVAIRDGKFLAVGNDAEIMQLHSDRTKLIDLNQRTVIPGLNDSHLHLIRGGLNYNLEVKHDSLRIWKLTGKPASGIIACPHAFKNVEI